MSKSIKGAVSCLKSGFSSFTTCVHNMFSDQASAKLNQPIMFIKQEQFISIPRKHVNENKKILVLDLDETLIHGSINDAKYDFTLLIDMNNNKQPVRINIRPGAVEFIQALAPFYEIILFTASIQQYAELVIKELNLQNEITCILSRDQCSYCNYLKCYVKDLTYFQEDLKNIIIVDNSPKSFFRQPENAILIKSYFDDKNDQELKKLMPLIMFLSYVQDVRILPIVKSYFEQQKDFYFFDEQRQKKQCYFGKISPNGKSMKIDLITIKNAQSISPKKLNDEFFQKFQELNELQKQVSVESQISTETPENSEKEDQDIFTNLKNPHKDSESALKSNKKIISTPKMIRNLSNKLLDQAKVTEFKYDELIDSSNQQVQEVLNQNLQISNITTFLQVF